MTSDGIANGRCLGRYWSIGAVTRRLATYQHHDRTPGRPRPVVVALIPCAR